jgi:hypothetical protein
MNKRFISVCLDNSLWLISCVVILSNSLSKNGNLFIEHKNYERKLFGFIEKGDKNGIPLTNLANQAYFFHR